ncbi:Hypothetical predicted protein [Pelobates cultripes]|uniref:Uncharacterized protein n=1 Tax=Pelobates cultripes TaxID=61616 RepID=A0AAD1RG30_PELCU|nr:Hypothetical predicted protein [Pelobates cultripes]
MSTISFHLKYKRNRVPRRGQKGHKTYKNHRQTSTAEDASIIFNLFDKILAKHHYAVLNKGLTFVPVNKLNPLHVDIEKYKLQRILCSNELRKDSNITQSPRFSSHEKKDINSNNSSIKAFIQAVHKDAMEISCSPPKH